MATQTFIFLEKKFTLREMQVISINTHGLCQRQMAAYLECSEATVKVHLRNILRKLSPEITSSRKLTSISLTSGFDHNGNYKEVHLFDLYPEGMPWHPAKGANFPKKD